MITSLFLFLLYFILFWILESYFENIKNSGTSELIRERKLLSNRFRIRADIFRSSTSLLVHYHGRGKLLKHLEPNVIDIRYYIDIRFYLNHNIDIRKVNRKR